LRADVAELDPADPGHRKDPASSLVTVVSRGRYGTQVGSAVHEVMQRVDLDDARRGLEQLVSSAADHSDLPDGEPRDRVGRLVSSLLASDAFRRFAKAKSRRREMYVGAVDGDGAEQITIWGYVDAVFTNADGTLTLLDYKTDTAFTNPDELAERYRAQVSGYSFALTRATGRPVGEIKLVVARADGRAAHEIDVEPLPAAELLGRLRAASAPPGRGAPTPDSEVIEPDR
jgi:ATP-dependent exoDNAse (exonuclease V) beta subunit